MRLGSAAEIQQSLSEPRRSKMQTLVNFESWSARALGGWWVWRLAFAAFAGLIGRHGNSLAFIWIAVVACSDWIRIPSIPYFRKPT
jgi:hypothetical protein